jgi:hypothetical protein
MNELKSEEKVLAETNNQKNTFAEEMKKIQENLAAEVKKATTVHQEKEQNEKKLTETEK